MKPIDFEDCTDIFKAEGCGDLPAVVTNNGSIVSCWIMSEEEKSIFKKTGKIYLLVHGRQPPVALTVDKPYIKQENKKTGEG